MKRHKLYRKYRNRINKLYISYWNFKIYVNNNKLLYNKYSLIVIDQAKIVKVKNNNIENQIIINIIY